MSTVDRPRTSRNLAEANRKVRSPLGRLRGYIRSYVSCEGLAIFALFVTCWFWIGFALDYGFFKWTGIDWVQTLPWWLRAGVLGALLAGLVTVVLIEIVRLLTGKFSDPNLALVLERRYPEVLGDRLITAVELSNPEEAAKFGYSPDMVRETIHEAADRVDQVPVGQVFDWRRLVNRGVFIVFLTVGLYLLAGLAFAGWPHVKDAVKSALPEQFASFVSTEPMPEGGRPFALGNAYADFNEVAGIWVERNILLRNVIWPRRAHLELVGFNEAEARVGPKDPYPLRFRALKWVAYGPPTDAAAKALKDSLTQKNYSPAEVEEMVALFKKDPPEGVRPLTWFDLTPRMLGGEAVPAVALPSDWKAREPHGALTIDEIELKLGRSETHQTLSADAHKAFQDAVAQLNETAGTRALRRTFNRLEVPASILVTFRQPDRENAMSFSKEGDNEYRGEYKYAGNFEGRDPVRVGFGARAEDYSTTDAIVTVVPPPGLEALLVDESQPASLFYRPSPDGDPAVFKGRRQDFQAVNRLQSGNTEAVLTVPAGTNVVVTGVSNKPLYKLESEFTDEGDKKLARDRAPRAVWVKKPAGVEKDPAVRRVDDNRFAVTFDDVRGEPFEFRFVFHDSDGVRGEYTVTVKNTADDEPIADLSMDGGRKTKEGFMVTALARVPFSGQAKKPTPKDKTGLRSVRYVYTAQVIESVQVTDPQTLLLLATIPQFANTPNGGLGPVAALGDILWKTSKTPRTPAKKPDEIEVPVAGFESMLTNREERPFEYLPLREVTEGLDVRARLALTPVAVQACKDLRDALEKGEADSVVQTRREALTRALDLLGVVRPLTDEQKALRHDPALGRQKDKDKEMIAALAAEADRLEASLAAVKGQLETLPKLPFRDGAKEPDNNAWDLATRRARAALLKEYNIRSDRIDEKLDARIDEEPYNDFAVWKTGLAKSAGNYQPRYRLQVWLEVEDLDVDTPRVSQAFGPRKLLGPGGLVIDKKTPTAGKVVRSKDTYTFVVVTDTELMGEIAKDEEKLQLELELVKNILVETRSKLDRAMQDLRVANSANPEEGPLAAVWGRFDEMCNVLEKAQGKTAEVNATYAGILREMKLNQLDKKRIQQVETDIMRPMEEIAGQRGEFRSTVDRAITVKDALSPALDEFKRARDDKRAVNVSLVKGTVPPSEAAGTETRKQLDDLILKIEKVLEAMGKRIELGRVVAVLREMENEQRKQYELYEKVRKFIRDNLFRDD